MINGEKKDHMIRRQLLVFILLSALLLVAGCGKKGDRSPGNARSYSFTGQVMAIDPPSKQITIAHGDIPHFMKAMTMPFVVKDTSLFRGIEIGDSVRGVIVVQKPEVWLDSLALISKM
jgi:protein SCO1/2